ncbi:MAG: SGNH/GDSL hydrolase family protein [Verrucomicrobiota bacterium]
MNIILRFLMFAALLIAAPCEGDVAGLPFFKEGDRWCVVGDSITHDGSYHSLIYLYWATRHPDQRFTTINCGINGDYALRTLNRWNWDVFERNPTIVSVLLGMNDVFRGLYAPGSEGEAVEVKRKEALDQYSKSLTTAFEQLKVKGAKVILMSPSVYDDTAHFESPNNPGVNKALDICSQIVLTLAKQFGFSFVDIHTPMTALNLKIQEKDPQATLVSRDRVHPGIPGHLVMAYYFLKAQGAPAEIATIELDARQQKVLHASNCHIDLRKTSTSEIAFDYHPQSLPFPVPEEAQFLLDGIPFIQDLNQERLKISGLDDGNYELLINGQSIRTYPSAELDQGINLATEKTPAMEQAMKVAAFNKARSEKDQKLRGLIFVGNCVYPTGVPPNTDPEEIAKKYEEISRPWNSKYHQNQLEQYRLNKPREEEIRLEVEHLTDDMWKAAIPGKFQIEIRKK